MAESKKKTTAGDAQDLDEIRDEMRRKMGFNDESADMTLLAVDELAEQAAEMEKLQAELEAARRDLQKTQNELETMREALATHQAEVELAEVEASEKQQESEAKRAEAEQKLAEDEARVKEAEARLREATEAAKVAAAAVGANGEVDASLAAVQSELKDVKNQLLRKAADFENYRRRTQRDLAESRSRAKAEAAEPFLDVLDDIGRTLDAAHEAEKKGEGGAAFKTLLEGLEMVQSKFLAEFGKLGVAPIDAVGQPFDEHLHEALMQQPAPKGTASGTVLHEIRKGYKVGDRVIRHAQVIVAQ